jgi:ATP-dependent Clp protease ATP-binding subunit ClpA
MSGDNQTVDVSGTIVVMTSNLGARRNAASDFRSDWVCFTRPQHFESPQHPWGDPPRRVEAARRRFSPEFLNRIDNVVVFRALAEDDLRKILDIELNRVQERIMASQKNKFTLNSTWKAKDFLLKEGTDTLYGARHLKRAIERHLVIPLSSLIASCQIEPGDEVVVDCLVHADGLAFSKTLEIESAATVSA